MPTIQVNNQKVSYRQWGSGNTTLLMLHGWPADSSHYEKIGQILSQNKSLTIIVPDLPGWGQTEAPLKAWTVSDYRDWTNDFISALNLKNIFLFGHSFGGRIAIKYSIQYPYNVKGLILCAAAGVKPDPTTAKRTILLMLAKTGKLLFSLPVMSQLAPLAKRVLYKLAGSQDYNKANGVMKDTIVKVLDEDLTALLPQLTNKTLLIWGTEDGATPLADGQLMKKLIPQSKLMIIDGQKHNLPKNAPKETAKHLLEFIESEQNTMIV